MANEEHLEILKRGVEQWNRWREENPEVRPDLREADLEGALLVSACLEGVRLEGANLVDARLDGASFDDARLDGARLLRANLDKTRLVRTSLDEAHLVRAILIRTILDRASLVGAFFKGAYLGRTVFSEVDLCQVRGLKSVEHLGPSMIGTSTLDCSQGQIPGAFLRGCGLSDWEIEAAKLWNPDLTEDERTLVHYEIQRIQGEQPIIQTRLFISYSHGDSEFVEALEPLLDGKGVRYWRDVHDMRAGRIETQIDRGIALHPLVLLILSENSVWSDWVEDEATRARELERQYRDRGQPRDVLCPVALDEAWKKSDWPRWLRRQIEDYAILDFSGWRDPDVLEEQFGKLYEGIALNYRTDV